MKYIKPESFGRVSTSPKRDRIRVSTIVDIIIGIIALTLIIIVAINVFGAKQGVLVVPAPTEEGR